MRDDESGALLLLGIQGTELTDEEATRFERLQPAGYVLFSRNIAAPAQTRALTDRLRALSREEPILAIDQEGGRVSRLGAIAPACPSAAEFAAANELNGAALAAGHCAELLRLLGLNLNLAPVLDLDHHPDLANALRGRSWGRDPQRVIDRAGIWNRNLRRRGMASCGKHFPAGGRALSDPHHDLPVSSATLEELLREDVIPYTALMPELDAVMLAHVEFPQIDPELPASLSPRIIRRFLRDQLGFDRHLVMTDDLDMDAIGRRFGRGEDARRAIEAGNDLALICHRTETAEQAAGEIASLPGWQRREAWRRIARFRKKALNGPLQWSDARWRKACDGLAAVREKVPVLAPPVAETQSPVTDY